jgi:hypothetical protein
MRRTRGETGRRFCLTGVRWAAALDAIFLAPADLASVEDFFLTGALPGWVLPADEAAWLASGLAEDDSA